MSEIEYQKNTTEGRYEVLVDGKLAGLITYRDRPKGIALPHTEVFPEYGGQGLATKLAKFALDEIRSEGRYVIPLCPFVAKYVTEHADVQDLVEPEFKELMGL